LFSGVSLSFFQAALPKSKILKKKKEKSTLPLPTYIVYPLFVRQRTKAKKRRKGERSEATRVVVAAAAA
jgi:hypothetical protein